MGLLRLIPNSKKLRVVIGLASLVVLAPITLYVFLLGANTFTALRISRLLDSLERIRVGDPAHLLPRSVRSCVVEQNNDAYCQITIPPLHYDKLQSVAEKLLNDPWKLNNDLARLGLRGQYMTVTGSVENDRIQKMRVSVIVHGRYESLGTVWEIASSIPTGSLRDELTNDERRTFIGWVHITSLLPGEGFRIYLTPASTSDEMNSRRLNRGCLFSLRGCDGLCELLPDAVPVLNARHRDWGGRTGVPPSHCDVKIKSYHRRD